MANYCSCFSLISSMSILMLHVAFAEEASSAEIEGGNLSALLLGKVKIGGACSKNRVCPGLHESCSRHEAGSRNLRQAFSGIPKHSCAYF